MANTVPVADDVTTVGNENDAQIAITLTAFDAEDIDSIATIFRLNSLPLHGMLFDQFDNPVIIGDDYPASGFDIGLGRWTLPLYFVPDANWSGGADFSYISLDSSEAESNSATATLTVNPIADTPLIDPPSGTVG